MENRHILFSLLKIQDAFNILLVSEGVRPACIIEDTEEKIPLPENVSIFSSENSNILLVYNTMQRKKPNKHILEDPISLGKYLGYPCVGKDWGLYPLITTFKVSFQETDESYSSYLMGVRCPLDKGDVYMPIYTSMIPIACKYGVRVYMYVHYETSELEELLPKIKSQITAKRIARTMGIMDIADDYIELLSRYLAPACE